MHSLRVVRKLEVKSNGFNCLLLYVLDAPTDLSQAVLSGGLARFEPLNALLQQGHLLLLLLINLSEPFLPLKAELFLPLVVHLLQWVKLNDLMLALDHMVQRYLFLGQFDAGFPLRH